MANERIQLTDTAQDAIAKLAGSNPGALSVCCELFKQGAEIDPDAFGGGLAGLLSLDSHNIYGSDIWMLYKDVCDQSLPKMVGVLRAVQLGIESEAKLKHAIQNRGDGIDVAALFDAVCERLPNFKAANALEAETVAA
jgi:hypothetical protein